MSRADRTIWRNRAGRMRAQRGGALRKHPLCWLRRDAVKVWLLTYEAALLCERGGFLAPMVIDRRPRP